MTKYLMLLCVMFLFTANIYAQLTDKVDKERAKISEAYCASTAEIKATKQMIMDKVDEAVALLEKEGKKAYGKFHGKGSKFLFAGTYIWLHDMKGVMLMHPIKLGLIGKELLGLKDGNGKRFFVEMIDISNTKGSGWVDYTWPKPGEKTRSLKLSFVKKAKVGKEEIVVGCGTYDLT